MKKIIILFWAAIFIIMGCSQSQKKILVIYSYHPEYEWCRQEKKGIEDGFKAQDVTIESFYLNTKRKSDKAWKKKITNEAIEKIDSYKPNLVIVCDDNACQLVATQFIDKKIPFVFTGINGDPHDYGMPAKNITGVLERNLIDGTIGLLQQLDSSVKTVAIITDDGTTSRAAIPRFTKDNFPVNLTKVYSTNDFDEWKSYVKELNEQVDALGIYMYFTLKGEDSDENIPDGKVLQWTLNNISIPSFCFEEFSVKGGVLCGETQSGFEQGKEAALMAVEILTGTAPDQLPLRVPKMGTMLINKKTADKLNIIIPDDLKHKAKIIE